MFTAQSGGVHDYRVRMALEVLPTLAFYFPDCTGLGSCQEGGEKALFGETNPIGVPTTWASTSVFLKLAIHWLSPRKFLV